MHRSPRLVGLVTGAAVTLAVLALYLAGAFEWLELRSYDLRYALSPADTVETPIVLVRIDEETEAKLQARAADISRRHYATAVRRLAEAGAALIAFDAVFDRPRDPADDAAFARALGEAGNVVLARYIGERQHRTPIEPFRAVERGEALINVELDHDGILRHMPLLGFDYAGGQPEPVVALALEVARLYRFPRQEHELELDRPEEIRLGPLRIPYPDGRMRIHFYGPPGTFPRIPFWTTVTGRVDPALVRNKIVLIGASAPALHDYYQTPYTDRLVMALTGELQGTRGVRMDGFEIHANAVQTILDGRFVLRSRDTPWLVPLLIALVGTIGTGLMVRNRHAGTPAWLLWTVLTAGIVVTAYGLFAAWRYWLDAVPLGVLAVTQCAAGVGYQRYLEARKRREIEAIFGRYVSKQVTQYLVDNPAMANPSGRKERLTMLFSDVRGFTAMSEKMEPQEVQQLLSEYFTEMTRILFAHGGTLDKFMGDAIMAFFGNPEPQPDHARRAVAAALAMQQAIDGLNRRWAAAGRQTIGVGIGINTGEVTVGNLGSTDFLDYTVIGDAVNLACRLEQHAGAGEVLISETTYLEVKDELKVEYREPIRVKGKRELVRVYQVLQLYDGPLIG